MTKDSFCRLGLAVIATEKQAIEALAERIDEQFALACELVLQCKGRVVVSGMGKSGHIGRKIAATMASTGTPAFFLHPGEASHGDLGMITAQDLVVAISNSGESEELLTILPIIKRLHVPLIAMTGNPNSTLAKMANVHLDISVEKEACPLGLAPTSSTTATLVMGDALAISVLDARGFTADDFARSHPGGRLGRRLLIQIGDVMHQGLQIPQVEASTSLKETLMVISAKGLGIAVITNEQQQVLGVFTDGDLRRTLDQNHNLDRPIETLMTKECKTIHPDQLAAEALEMMDRMAINALPVVNQEQQLIGVINMHALLRAGVV